MWYCVTFHPLLRPAENCFLFMRPASSFLSKYGPFFKFVKFCVLPSKNRVKHKKTALNCVSWCCVVMCELNRKSWAMSGTTLTNTLSPPWACNFEFCYWTPLTYHNPFYYKGSLCTFVTKSITLPLRPFMDDPLYNLTVKVLSNKICVLSLVLLLKLLMYCCHKIHYTSLKAVYEQLLFQPKF